MPSSYRFDVDGGRSSGRPPSIVGVGGVGRRPYTRPLDPARVGKGAIGWGCWTAHSDYDDKGKYLEQLKDH